ncbi:MAG: type IV secretory system conjugative DNA transfer family protein [Nitrososphaerota archaeon]|nr:type IV secretory system conjugative DNA transfer family protein [Nitrososphaerota archaeon]
MSSQNPNSKVVKNRLHVLGIDAEIDPAIGKKLKRGIYCSDRIHSLVMGFPGCGKTRFLLSMIKQHIDHNEGFMVIDSHSDLTNLVLSHIPPEQWDRVIYINPWSAFEDKYDHQVLQINFLESKDPYERDVVARMFMDTLEKIYERWWGPRLDMILLNALYLLMEKENAKLPDLYKILADNDFRDMLTAKCMDQNVRTFWEKQYDKMPKDASMAVLTKLYRIVQERILVPMFMAEKSCIDFRVAMDQRKIVIVDLPEGVITTDMANFLGSLILSATYNAGMSREDIPEHERVPFYVYVDEAYRYTTKSIPETLQSLRKFKVYITLASQYLTQYRKDIQDAITQTCETIISFRVGEDTARTLEKFYPKNYGYQTLMNLPRHLFFVSTPFQGNREYQVLETLDYKTGQSDPEKVIQHSLERYGRKVDVDELMGQVKTKSLQRDFLDWPVTPAEWTILLTVRLLGGYVDEDTLREHLLYNPATPKPYVLTEMGFVNALKNLAVDNAKREAYLSFKEETTRQYREETYAYGKKELRAKEIRTRNWRLDLSDKKAKRLLDVTFRGEKAGGVKHIQTIMAQRKVYWLNGWIVRIDDGATDESLADLYVTPTLPASKTEGAKGYIDHTSWDYKRSFAVEVECYPKRHWDRLKDNYQRNKKMGFPTVFIVPNQTDEEALKEKLLEWNATIVVNSSRFEPDHPEMTTIEIMDLLDNQTKDTTETIAPCETEPANQPIEQTPQEHPITTLEQTTTSENEADPSIDEAFFQKEQLLLGLASKGWRFRLKDAKGKKYLCTRNDKEEHSIGLFDDKTKTIIEKHKINIQGHNEKQN